VAKPGDDLKGSTALVGQLSNFASRGLTLNLDSRHHTVPDVVNKGVTRLVCALGMSKATVLHKEPENGLGERSVLADEGQVLGDGSSIIGA
jgi:hypothetical protein